MNESPKNWKSRAQPKPNDGIHPAVQPFDWHPFSLTKTSHSVRFRPPGAWSKTHPQALADQATRQPIVANNPQPHFPSTSGRASKLASTSPTPSDVLFLLYLSMAPDRSELFTDFQWPSWRSNAHPTTHPEAPNQPLALLGNPSFVIQRESRRIRLRRTGTLKVARGRQGRDNARTRLVVNAQ